MDGGEPWICATQSLDCVFGVSGQFTVHLAWADLSRRTLSLVKGGEGRDKDDKYRFPPEPTLSARGPSSCAHPNLSSFWLPFRARNPSQAPLVSPFHVALFSPYPGSSIPSTRLAIDHH